ncbi:MAG: hypothetical protein JNM17_35135 [Archangium sp.]|nr:hypothetical protein [Archangium sp.]
MRLTLMCVAQFAVSGPARPAFHAQALGEFCAKHVAEFAKIGHARTP